MRRVDTPQAMEALGGELAGRARPGMVVHLEGPLAAGKTTLVRGFLRALGHRGAVRSPTFTLVEPYELCGRRVYHFDLYRIVDAEELEYLGLRDYFDGEAICLIEWPERGAGLLPAPDLRVRIAIEGERRRVELEPDPLVEQRSS